MMVYFSCFLLISTAFQISYAVTNKNQKNNDWTEITISPTDIVPFEHQVAGHVSLLNVQSEHLGVMKHNDGSLLKPVTHPIYGPREIDFYHQIQTSKNSILMDLKKFIPKCFGIGVLQFDGKDIKCLRMENITNGLKSPCVMDIKIGMQTWEPGVSKEKIEKSKSKYTACRQRWRFSINGYKFKNAISKTSEKVSKHWKMTPGQAIEAIYNFVNKEIGITCGITKNILNKLRNINDWFKNQRNFLFYGSSILLAYDAEELKPNLPTTSSSNPVKVKSPKVRVYMIDFAHTIPNIDKKPDVNYRNSLEGLINVFKNLSKYVKQYDLQKTI